MKSNTERKKLIRVLYVDDEPAMLDLTRIFLEKVSEDFMVETASSGEEAIEKLTEEKYDVIVSDYKMPGMDGIQLLIKLRKNRDKTPFIIFTNMRGSKNEIKAYQKGANGYVRKSGNLKFQYLKLASQISEAVNHRKPQNMPVVRTAEAIATS